MYLPECAGLPQEEFDRKFSAEIAALEGSGEVQLQNPVVARLNDDGRYFCILR